MIFFLAELCPNGGTPEKLNKNKDDSFDINEVPAVGETPVGGNVLDDDGVQQLPSGSTLQLTPNEEQINPGFTAMKLTTTVTGGTTIILTFYDENNTPLPNPVRVSTSDVLFPLP